MLRYLLLALTTLFGLFSCASYEQFKHITEDFEIPAEIFNADYTQTWQAVLAVMKTYDIATQSQEAGVIKTRWRDNTLEMNFADSFGGSDAVKAARFKLIVNVVKGYKSTREVTKVTVYRRQMVEEDMLQGWREIPSDGIDEKTILYRIGREIAIDNKLKEIEEKKRKAIEAQENF